MKTKEVFDLAIKMGIESDFREVEGVKKFLKKKKEKYEKLSPEKKEYFDINSLENPYLDSRVLNISEDKEIKKILVGIDIGPAEILMAKEIGDIDLIVSHHPTGKALAHLADVMDLQCDVLNKYGVPINIAEGLMKERISEVARGVNGINHQRTVDAARIMQFNLMNCHTPCDNLAAKFLKEKINEKKEVAVVRETEGEVKPIVEINCPECKNDKAYFWTMQTRSSDESETKFYKCTKCKYTWRDYR